MRKLICFTVSLMLLLTAASPALAKSGESKGLEKAIGVVKSAVTIPADFSDFQYSSYQQESESGDSVTVWCLQWGKEDGSAAVSANVDDLFHLVNYNYYADKEEDGLAKVAREAGQNTAAAFLSKAMPGLSEDMRLVNEKRDSATTWGLLYTYQLFVNGIPAPFIQAQIRINKYTGEVESFDGLDAGQKIPQFPSEKPTYSLDEGGKLYAEKIPAKLSYYCYYDSQKKSLSVFPGYAIEDGGSKVIDAVTGEVKDVYHGQMERGGYGAASDAEANSGSAPSLTPEEQAAVDNVSGLISKEKAERILRETAEGIDGSQKVTRTYLGKDSVEPDRYYWSVTFDRASGTVDARTGEVLSFSIYSESEGKAALTREEAQKKAASFAEKTAGAKWKKTLLSDGEKMNRAYGKEDGDISSYSFLFERQENGIGVKGNGLYVTVDAQNGKILSYNNEWYESAVFPSIEKAIKSTDAFQKFNEAGKLRLSYVMTEKDKVSLVFDFENPVTPYLIDPFTGAQIGRNGKAYQSNYLPEYDDIEGHWAAETIEALLNNGYYLEGQSFQPDAQITQQDFLQYLYSPGWKGAVDQEAFYKMLERNKIVFPGEKSPDKRITRQEAAKYMVRYLGFDALAQKSSIFKDMFSDKVSDDYRGYAAICYGLNIMKGDKNGRFNGAEGLTRAEAACALYQLLEVK